MSEPASHALPPHVQLIQMGTASWISAVVYAAARLGIADHLAAGPRSAAELAGATGTHAPSLHRLMRTLASLGILTERDGQRFALTPLGEALKTGAPGSARATLLTFCSSGVLAQLGRDHLFAADRQDRLREGHGHAGLRLPGRSTPRRPPTSARRWSASTARSRRRWPRPTTSRGSTTVVDVGGATGNMLAAILSRHPATRGVLFDRPHVVGDAPALLKAHGVDERVTIEAGDFFERRPGGRRRLPAVAHHPRLERGAVPHHPGPLPRTP